MQFLNYDVTSNPNKDMMVAEMAENMIENQDTYLKTGVPTLFNHVLSQIQFKIKTKEDYSASATFALKSLTMKNVYAEGDYTQGSPTAFDVANIWDGYAKTTDLSVYTNAGFPVTNTSDANALTPAANDYYIMLPQEFTDDTPKLEIVYTITTNYTGLEVVETVTEEVKLQTVYDAWIPGKTHVLTITLAMDEILWDPATVDWVEYNTPTASL
ncbi:MAG: fimbrillin family protein [Bacteroidales bacterium]|nr:fimbrillin family protein [Bacteroidales bacterium]